MGLVKRYGSVIAVDALDLRVQRGECFGLLGPNGAGKTTAIEILEGLLTPDAGEVSVLGLSWASDSATLRPRLGIQLQETQLADKLSVGETLSLFRSFYPDGPPVDELLDTVELTSKRDAWVSKLSGGQKQRLSVACALAGRPELLFLDEPTTGLDPQSSRQLWAVLERFRRGGGTILITTHYMDEAHAFAIASASWITASSSRLARRGSSSRRLAPNTWSSSPSGAANRRNATISARSRESATSGSDGHMALATSELHSTVPALLDLLRRHGAALTQLGTHSATLEDVFVRLTGRQLRDG